MKFRQTMGSTALSAVFASLGLAGCGQGENAHIARNDANTAVVRSQSGAEAATVEPSQAAREAAEATRQAANEVKQSAQTAADQATDKVSDAMITTSINAELAKDPALSSQQIDVDTDGGRVALRGTAPDEQARVRAAQIAGKVQGVVAVDNHITVQAKS